MITPVAMAAGEGTRLRPLTERWPKTLLPIDGRPVIATLLRELASAGVDEVAVVTGHLAGQVESLVGDGTAFGVSVTFVRQPEALGSAQAVVRALDAGIRPPLLVTAADTVFVPGDIGRITEAWGASRAAGAVGVRRGGRPDQTRVQVEDGRVTELAGNAGEHSAAPIWFLGDELAESLRAVPGPPFEIAYAVQETIAAGMEILALEMGRTRDLTRPADVVAYNFPYLLRDGR